MRARGAATALLVGSVLAAAVGGAGAALQERGPALAVGDPLLDFTAQDHTGADFTLSSLKGKPILLKIFRGHW